MNLGSLAEDNIKRFGEYEAIYFERKWYTNVEGNHDVNRLGNALKSLGIGKGDRVAMQALHSPPVFTGFPLPCRIQVQPTYPLAPSN